MRGFLFGLVLLVAFTVTVLSLRPGGLREQLRFVGRRLKIALVLGGVYVGLSTAFRLVFVSGPVTDWAPPALALLLITVFLVLGRDPQPASRSDAHGRRS